MIDVGHALPIADAAAELGLSVGQLRRLAEIRHSMEKSGLKWTGPVTMQTLATTNHWLVKQLGAATARIKKLEEQASKLQEVVTHAEKHSLRFAGAFDLGNSYAEGAITRYKEMLFVALKDIPAGKSYPARQGSGWAPFA